MVKFRKEKNKIIKKVYFIFAKSITFFQIDDGSINHFSFKVRLHTTISQKISSSSVRLVFALCLVYSRSSVSASDTDEC